MHWGEHLTWCVCYGSSILRWACFYVLRGSKFTQHGVKRDLYFTMPVGNDRTIKKSIPTTDSLGSSVFFSFLFFFLYANTCSGSVKPPELLEICSGNPAHSWEKWKLRFEICLQATGTSTKRDVQKVGLLLNHTGDRGIEIYWSFHFSPETPVWWKMLIQFQLKTGTTKLPWKENLMFDVS